MKSPDTRIPIPAGVVTTTIRVRAELHKRLRFIAEAEQKTVFEITDILIENYVRGQEIAFGAPTPVKKRKKGK